MHGGSHPRTGFTRGARTSDLPRWRRAVRNARGVLDWPLRLATLPSRVLPDFVVIGAMKSGTTSLYDHLVRQPGIVAARTKETKFFDPPSDRGTWWYRAQFPTERELERSGPVRALTGEATPSYLLYPHAPAQIAAALPDARFIAILRDPVQRAWSHYRHSRRLGHEPLDSFAAAIAAEPDRIAGEWQRMVDDPGYHSDEFRWRAYATRGEYASQLERWFVHHRPERTLVIFTDDLARDPEETVRGVMEFLGRPFQVPGGGFPRRNVSDDRSSVPRGVAADMRAHFDEHDAALAALLGRPIPWRS